MSYSNDIGRRFALRAILSARIDIKPGVEEAGLLCRIMESGRNDEIEPIWPWRPEVQLDRAARVDAGRVLSRCSFVLAEKAGRRNDHRIFLSGQGVHPHQLQQQR